MSVACSPAAPPKASSAKRRGSTPRRTETSRTPSAIVVLTTRWMPPRRATRSMPSAAAMPVDGRLGGRTVEPAPPAEKGRRVEIAEHQIGVGHRRGTAAVAVAGRARNRTGALRPDMQDAAGIDPRDRAAAGADAGDVEAVERDACGRRPGGRPPGSAGRRRSARCRCWSRPCRTGSDCPRRGGAPHRRCRRRRRRGRRAPRRRRAGPPRRSARPRHATG